MKTKSVIMMAICIAIAGMVNAQGGGMNRRTVEERVKAVHEKMDSAFKLDAANLTKVDSVFAGYYRSQDKMRADMMSGGDRPDFNTMREKMQPLMDDRDKQLKAILSDDQYKKWKDELEPAMMPRRRNGGGGGNGGGN